MDSPPSINPTLRQEWAIAGVLSHLQRALSHHNSAESLNQLQHDSTTLEQMKPELRANRVQVLAICQGLMEAERNKEMKKAYEELRSYFKEPTTFDSTSS